MNDPEHRRGQREVLHLPEVVSYLTRQEPTRQHAGHDCVTVFDHLCVACHGLSVLVNGRIGDETRAMLFDVGPYDAVWIDNAERLGVDLSATTDFLLGRPSFDRYGLLHEPR